MLDKVIENPNLREDSALKLQLRSNSLGKTVITHQYQTHPLRISRPFRLDRSCHGRAYLYLRNNSPGLFARDRLQISIDLGDNSQLYFTEQSATKVHPMNQGSIAEVNYQWKIEQQGIVEFVPEPLILYQNSALQQTTKIEIHPTASLFWSDLILPGRLARGECYQFRDYDHYLAVYSDRGELWFKERMYLKGRDNQFRHSELFASLPVLGNAIAIMPHLEVDLLKNMLDNLEPKPVAELVAATSVLPHNKGVLIRVLASKTQIIKSYWYSVINILRKLNHQTPVPQIPK